MSNTKSLPLWVIKATQTGKTLRATRGTLPLLLPIFQKAESPMTAAEVAKSIGWKGDDLPIRKSLCYLQGLGMLRSNRVPSRGHPFAVLECEYELADIDVLVDKE